MRRWLDSTFAALAVPAFRILWAGTLMSFLAFFMSMVVQSVVAFELTGANSAVGIVLFAQGFSMFTLAPIGGAYADRWPKRRVIATGQVVTSAVFAVTALLVASGAIRVWHLAAGAFVMGVCFAFIGPARQAFIVDIVPIGTRGNAMALSQVANNASRIGGPAVAGLLLAWDAAGAAGAYAVMALLYALSAASVSLLPRSSFLENAETHVLTDVAEGVRYVATHPRLRVIVLMYVAATMGGLPHVTVMPGLVENELGRESEEISLLMGLAAVGGLFVSLAVTRYADSARATAIFSAFGLAFGGGLFAFAASPSYASAALVSLLLGAANAGFLTLASAVVIHETQPDYVGRVVSLTMMAFAGFGLMGLPVGLLADAIGERGSLVAMGVVVSISVTAGWIALARAPAAAAAPSAPGA